MHQVMLTVETALIGSTADEELFHAFLHLQDLVQACTHPCFIGHVQAHSQLPGHTPEEMPCLAKTNLTM